MSEPPVSQEKRWRSRLRRVGAWVRRTLPFVAGVFAALIAVLIYNLLVPAPHQITKQEVADSIAQVLASATAPPAYSAEVYQVIRPSLVLIQTKTKTAGTDGKPEEGLGSGVIIDDQGDILTSLHVVADSTDIQITFADGTKSAGEIANQQPTNDIAVLRADNPPAQIVAATLGNPNAMHIGDEAYVVGNPFGLYGSMSAGVISGFNRSMQMPNSDLKLTGLIQIDAAVNPGNSGGPLLNRYGQVVGIVAALLNPTNQDVFIGVGLAVPITTAGGAAGAPPD